MRKSHRDKIVNRGDKIKSGRDETVKQSRQREYDILNPGPRLNIKTVLSTYGDFHVKDKTAVRTSYL